MRGSDCNLGDSDRTPGFEESCFMEASPQIASGQ